MFSLYGLVSSFFALEYQKTKSKPFTTKARNLESTKKALVFYITPFFFRVFVPSCFRDKGLPKAFSLQNTKEPNQNRHHESTKKGKGG